MAARTLECEVLIVGGGMVGLTLAIALADAGVAAVVVDRADPARQVSAGHDGRASAIARGSSQALAAIGAWEPMAGAAQAILDIRVSDGRVGRAAAPFFLHYDHAEAPDPDGTAWPLGYIVENRAIRQALQARAAALPSLVQRAPADLAHLERGEGGRPVEARLSNGTAVRARLAVAADGRDSRLRAAAGIQVTTWDYPQAGIVCTVAHEEPHRATAHEHFLPAGPFALLPMTDGTDGTHRSSLVWTDRKGLVAAMMALDDGDFGQELTRRFGAGLGALEPLGARWSYPLSLMQAARVTGRRLALVGDAAHVIHPIAGQGLNLGLRDVAALAETVVDAHRLGLDPGGADVLERYARWRRFDTVVLLAVTDGLNRLFSNDIAPVRLARDLGLATVGRVPPLKRLFMRHAMGLAGDPPRLVRGEAL